MVAVKFISGLTTKYSTALTVTHVEVACTTQHLEKVNSLTVAREGLSSAPRQTHLCPLTVSHSTLPASDIPQPGKADRTRLQCESQPRSPQWSQHSCEHTDPALQTWLGPFAFETQAK